MSIESRKNIEAINKLIILYGKNHSENKKEKYLNHCTKCLENNPMYGKQFYSSDNQMSTQFIL